MLKAFRFKRMPGSATESSPTYTELSQQDDIEGQQSALGGLLKGGDDESSDSDTPAYSSDDGSLKSPQRRLRRSLKTSAFTLHGCHHHEYAHQWYRQCRQQQHAHQKRHMCVEDTGRLSRDQPIYYPPHLEERGKSLLKMNNSMYVPAAATNGANWVGAAAPETMPQNTSLTDSGWDRPVAPVLYAAEPPASALNEQNQQIANYITDTIAVHPSSLSPPYSLHWSGGQHKKCPKRCQCQHPLNTVVSMSQRRQELQPKLFLLHHPHQQHQPFEHQPKQKRPNVPSHFTAAEPAAQRRQPIGNNHNSHAVQKTCGQLADQQTQLPPTPAQSARHHQHQHQQYPNHHHQNQLHSHLYQLHHGIPEQVQLCDKRTVFDGCCLRNGGRFNCLKNLVQSQKKIRRLRIILGIVFGLVVIGLLATALVFIFRGSDTQPATNDNTLDLEDILTGQLSTKRFNGTWSSGSKIIYKESNDIVEFDAKTKVKTVLYTDHQQHYVSFEKSADGNYLLLAKNYVTNYRHSFFAEYEVYDLRSNQLHALTVQGEQRALSMVQWAPVGNGLVLNYARNLYYKAHPLEAEVAITTDTHELVFNGIPDWVYEEEVLSSNSATWFNPTGTQIAFIKFDDSSTHVMNLPIYGIAGDLRFQYPFHRAVSYPKAGSVNPRVSLYTSNLESAVAGVDHLAEISRPSSLNVESDYIISVVEWLNDTDVLSVWMNRIQNEAYMQVSDGIHRSEVLSLTPSSGWVDLFSAPHKNKDGSRIALILPQSQGGDAGNYRHLCTLSTTSTPAEVHVLTKGKFEVQSVLHWDLSSDIIFYTANTEGKSEVQHVYAISATATAGQAAQCITCGLHTSYGVEQSFYSADFSSERSVMISSIGPGLPQYSVYEWTYANSQVSLTKVLDWEVNSALNAKLKGVAMPSLEIHTIDMENGFTAKVLMQLPPNMDTSGNTKYPMLVDVYGGPDSASVQTKWLLDWGTYLSSNQSVIYVKIDGRGSGLRGESLLHSIYMKLGTLEIVDQITVAKKLQEKFNFIDPNHMGIWGWSYGGYAAAMALTRDDDNIFKCAASVAPVTDWTYYDSIYTERYMGLPNVNEQGYNDSRLSTRAEKLRGKKFLLVHGTLDDNVHFQQAMILSKSLEVHDIIFKQISYPDEDHALAGVRPHLYHSLDRFFGDCFESERLTKSQ